MQRNNDLKEKIKSGEKRMENLTDEEFFYLMESNDDDIAEILDILTNNYEKKRDRINTFEGFP